MKLKKVLSGFLSAAIAITTSIITPLPVSAVADDVTVEVNVSQDSLNTIIFQNEKGNATIAGEAFTWSGYWGQVDKTTNDGDTQYASAFTSSSADGSKSKVTFSIPSSFESLKLTTIGFDNTESKNIGHTFDLDTTKAVNNLLQVQIVPNGDLTDASWYYSQPAKINYLNAEKAPFEGEEFKLNANQTYNYQSSKPVTATFNGTTMQDFIDTVESVTAEFVVNGATNDTDKNFDISKVKFSFSLVNTEYKWINVGSSTINGNVVTVTADNATIKAAIEKTAEDNSMAAADLIYSKIELIGAVDLSDTSSPVIVYHEDITTTIEEISEIPVSSISLNKVTLTLEKDSSEVLTANVEPNNATDPTVTWTSSEPTVAKVDQTGKVTALKTGTATITVTSTADETKAAECEVTVTNPATAIAIPTTASVLVGKTQTLAVTTTPADADELTYTWTTSDAAIVTVADGVVTGVAAGTAKITVTAGTLTASCDVTVTAEAKPITALTISDNTLEFEEGETGTLTYTATPADNTDEIEWITSNADVATVKNGVVTAVAEGKATITVQVKGNETISASCEVTVTAKAPEIETKPYKLTVTDASSWGKPGVTKAAQINVPITTLNGFKVGTTTYKDIKNKTLKLENLGFGSCTLEGVEAENVEVSIYLQLGANWEHWCATADYTLADGEVELDLSTLAAQGVKDTDVLQAIGFQFNIMGTVGGINDMTIGDNITLNAAEPKISVVGEEPPAEESDYDTGKVETVDDYVPAEAGTELVVRSITATQAAIYDSYTITVKDNNGKTYTTTTSDCYKAFKYNTASGEKTEEANGYFIIVKVTNVPAGTTVTVTIEPTK